jgi:hypothetical protein
MNWLENSGDACLDLMRLVNWHDDYYDRERDNERDREETHDEWMDALYLDSLFRTENSARSDDGEDRW